MGGQRKLRFVISLSSLVEISVDDDSDQYILHTIGNNINGHTVAYR
jgi:hypothetical protein